MTAVGLSSGSDKENPVIFGPFILISKTVYEILGTHCAIKGKHVDDISLGHLALESGVKITRYQEIDEQCKYSSFAK